MFSPKYWSRVSARISGKIDIENGYFDVAISKAKEVGCNFWGRNKPYAGEIMSTLARYTDVSEGELVLALSQVQAQLRAVKRKVIV